MAGDQDGGGALSCGPLQDRGVNAGCIAVAARFESDLLAGYLASPAYRAAPFLPKG